MKYGLHKLVFLSYLYPVHRQRFPSKHFSTSSKSGVVPHDEFFSWAEKKLWNIFSWSQSNYLNYLNYLKNWMG